MLKLSNKLYLKLETKNRTVPTCFIWFMTGMFLGAIYARMPFNNVVVFIVILLTYWTVRLFGVYYLEGMYSNRFNNKTRETSIYKNVLTREQYVLIKDRSNA